MKKFKVLFSIFFLALSLFVGFGNPQISEAKTTNTKAVTTAQPFIVYQDDKVIIMFKKITSRGVVFDVQNLTNINLTIQADSIAINGISTDDIIMSDDVAPQSTGEVIVRTGNEDITGVKEINRVSGQLRVIDFNYSFRSYDATFDIPLNETAGYFESTLLYPLLYTDEKVDIYYWATEASGVSFLVRNKTSINITIQADSISVNQRSYNSIIMSDNVAPRSVGVVKARCAIEADNIATATVGGQLSVIDFKTLDSYDVTFINIPVI